MSTPRSFLRKVGKDEQVVTVWAEGASGPGWTNRPVWILVRELGGKLRIDCLQPDRHTREIDTLYAISEAVHGKMRMAVRAVVGRGRG